MRKLAPLALLAAAVTACTSAPTALAPVAKESAQVIAGEGARADDGGAAVRPAGADANGAVADTGSVALAVTEPPPPPPAPPPDAPPPDARPDSRRDAIGRPEPAKPMPVEAPMTAATPPMNGPGASTSSSTMSAGPLLRSEAFADAKRAAIEKAKESSRGKAETKAEAKLDALLGSRGDVKKNDVAGSDPEASIADGDGRFESAGVNPLVDARVDNLSTFAIDVDTGSFTLARRFLESGTMPSAAGVRVEEWVNAFHYSYAGPESTGEKHPFSISMEGAPLAKQSTVLRIGIQGKRIAKQHRDPVHLTFLVDVSGSMRSADRLPLAKQALELLVNELNDKDSVSLVTYAGNTSVVLPSTSVTQAHREKIKSAIESLQNGGGTNMGSGMELAYREANKALGDKGISRVIVLSDGDANIGHTSHQAILKSIKGYVSEGVTMSTIGFGTGNYRDDTMEQLADAGNGNYSYVGSLKDAKKIFVDDLTGTLQVIAKDTKIQVEMNPDVVASYRLIGYENRDIADRDFRNDKVDAGEIGAGHTVTALYEVQLRQDDPTGNIATVRVRYKQPKGDEATEVAAAFPASALKQNVSDLSVDARFAVGVGLAAEVFRHSPHMDRLGIDLADAERLMKGAATGPYASERQDLVRLIAPLANGANVARR